MLHYNMQGATTVGWRYYTPAVHAVKTTKENTLPSVMFPNAQDLPPWRTKLLYVSFANKPLKPKGDSLNMNGLNTLWNATRNERRLK
jgi:hypothetical protein